MSVYLVLWTSSLHCSHHILFRSLACARSIRCSPLAHRQSPRSPGPPHQSMNRRCSHPYIVWLPTLHPRTFQENRSSRTFKRDEPYVRGENPVFAAERKRPYPAEDTPRECRDNSRSSAGNAHSRGHTLRQRTKYRRGMGSQPLRLLVAYRGGRRLIFRSSRVDDDVCRRATVGRRRRRATCRRSAYEKKGWKEVQLDVQRLPERKDDRKGMWKNGGTIA